jgi:hypothetical protein
VQAEQILAVERSYALGDQRFMQMLVAEIPRGPNYLQELYDRGFRSGVFVWKLNHRHGNKLTTTFEPDKYLVIGVHKNRTVTLLNPRGRVKNALRGTHIFLIGQPVVGCLFLHTHRSIPLFSLPKN